MTKEYAVIFRTKRTLPMPVEYEKLNQQLAEMVKTIPGFKRIESIADANGNGVSISYWDSLESIQAWKNNSTHLFAQSKGKSDWYQDYSVEICEVLRSYSKGSRPKVHD
jgi:heme-degrading monooxygenase HmoA